MVAVTPSGRGNPCPICGRHEDGDCRISETKVFCWHGTTHGPPDGLKPGQVLDGGWAYTGESDCGGWAVFVAHEGRSSPRSAASSPRSGQSSPRSAAPTGRQAFQLLEAAGQLAEEEAYVAQRGKGYQSRWLRWSAEASPGDRRGGRFRRRRRHDSRASHNVASSVRHHIRERVVHLNHN